MQKMVHLIGVLLKVEVGGGVCWLGDIINCSYLQEALVLKKLL